MKIENILLLGVGAYALYSLVVKSAFIGDPGVSTSSPGSLPYGIDATKTTKENLDSANAAFATFDTSVYSAPKQSSQAAYAVAQNKAVAAVAAASGRAQQYVDAQGNNVTIGPTGNVYVTSPKGKLGIESGSYTPGPNTASLGASRNTAASQATMKAALAANVAAVGTYKHGTTGVSAYTTGGKAVSKPKGKK